MSLVFVSCQVNPALSIYDLAAIHNPVTWQPVANAEVEARYEISDHRELEEAILVNMGSVDSQDFSNAFELSSWMLLVLVHDENSDARRLSLAILGNMAGGWVTHNNARAYDDGVLSIEQGLAMMSSSTTAAELEAACLAILKAPTPNTYVAARIMAALGRTIHLFAVDPPRHAVITSMALRMVEVGLSAAMADSDSDVSTSAQRTIELLMEHAH